MCTYLHKEVDLLSSSHIVHYHPIFTIWSRFIYYQCYLQVVVTELSGQICQICGDELEVTVNGEPFVACNECAFPVCRPCYEYERREGNQVCPQCKTRYKRIKGEEASTNFYFDLFVCLCLCFFFTRMCVCVAFPP